MKGSRIEVAICLDRHMLHAAAVLLASLKAHATLRRPVRVFVLGDHRDEAFDATVAAMGDERFTAVPLRCTSYERGPVRDYLTAALYMRFQLPALLPQVERVLYLDVDIVVNRDLAALFDTELGGCSTAAVPDWPMVAGTATWPMFRIPYAGRRYRFGAYAREVLGLDLAQRPAYFNTGVLLMDLARWRRDDVAGRTLARLAGAGSLYYPDQDALNAELKGAFVALDARWNAQAICMAPRVALPALTRRGRRWAAIRRLWRDDPWIVHYAGANKPWEPSQPSTPRDELWWSHAAASPMREAIEDAYRLRLGSSRRRRMPLSRGAG